jgi:Na+/melibiose symporter-like transporter
MPYFFIAPAFLLFTVMSAGAVLVSWLWKPLRPIFPYAWRSWLWGSVGFLLANMALAAIAWSVIQQTNNVDPVSAHRHASGFAVAVTLFLGPFVASAAGTAVGIAFGCFLAFRQRRSVSPIQP